uniref:Uncharacterized protein n=1 Tax=Astyanax mexicanus TaxID=7994 RepID=A0A3B1J4N4_ASTMX
MNCIRSLGGKRQVAQLQDNRMHQTSTCPGGVKYISSLIYEENVIRDRITYTEHQGHTNILGYGFRTWLPS